MTIVYIVELLCDECQSTIKAQMSDRPIIEGVLAKAAQEGWIRRKIGKSMRDFCSECSSLFEDNRDESRIGGNHATGRI